MTLYFDIQKVMNTSIMTKMSELLITKRLWIILKKDWKALGLYPIIMTLTKKVKFQKIGGKWRLLADFQMMG